MNGKSDVPKRQRKLLIALAVCGFLLLMPNSWAAAQMDMGLVVIETPNVSAYGISETVIRLVRLVLGIVFFVLLVKLLRDGFNYMTYDGSEDARAEAIEAIISHAKGMFAVIVLSAATRYAVTAVANAMQSNL